MTFCCQLILLTVLFLNTIHHSVAPPVTQKPEVENDILDNIGVEYKRYLQEVIQTLESDDEFRKKLETVEDADLRSGKIAQELQYVRHDVRSKLDELKRAELERLRHLLRRQSKLRHEQTGHIDGANPRTFEIADLEKLIAKTSQHLAEADRRRREEFKQYELQKEFERKQEHKMKDKQHDGLDYYVAKQRENEALNEGERRLHHPASKKQLEEVWQYQDHMNVQDFNPKTFFFLHDVDGNGYLDEQEVKALFLRELQKLYSVGYAPDDLRERSEQMERMREHVFSEADTNHDSVISLEEWLELTRRPDFNSDPGWKPVNPREVYTRDEYRKFEEQRQKEIDALVAQGKLPPKSAKQIQMEADYIQHMKKKFDIVGNTQEEVHKKFPHVHLTEEELHRELESKDYPVQLQQQANYQPHQQGQFQPQHQGQFQPQHQGQFQHHQQGQFQHQQQGQFQPQQQGQFQPQQQGQFQPQQQGQFQPQLQGQFQPQLQGQFQPQLQGQFQPQQQGQVPPLQQGQVPPLQQGQVPPLQQGQVPPQHQGQVQPQDQGQFQPQHQGQVQPQHQGQVQPQQQGQVQPQQQEYVQPQQQARPQQAQQPVVQSQQSQPSGVNRQPPGQKQPAPESQQGSAQQNAIPQQENKNTQH